MVCTKHITIACATVALLLAGCKHVDTTAMTYATAINTYYAAHPSCLWTDPVKLPVQVDTKDTTRTSGYDALVDQALLVRTTAEKQVFIIASKQVTNYDLNDRGRSSWTPDPTQPGFGNFCYGHRNVQTIDAAPPNNPAPGALAQVAYHYTLVGMPSWALASETQNAFPQLKAELAAASSDTATLINTSAGWQVKAPTTRAVPSSADGKIVE